MFSRRTLFLILCVCAFLLSLQLLGGLSAQEAASTAAAAAEAGPKKTTFFEFIKHGGPIFVVIVLLSMYAVGLIVDRFMFYKDAGVKEEKKFIDSILQTTDIKMSISLCDKTAGCLPRVFKTALTAYEKNLQRKQIEEEIEVQFMNEILALEKNLPQLDTMVTMTPLLGLLGTVIGMISSFNVVAAVGMGKPEMLAGGISEALVNTAGGLAVAIPSLFAFNYFAGKKEAILMSIEKNVSKLLMRFEDFKKAEGKKKAPEA
jgi:biopolymer transport protein ExbB